MTHAARIRWAEALRIRWTEALRIRWGMCGMSAVISAGLLTLTVLVAVQLPTQLAQAELPAGDGASLAGLASTQPSKQVDVIVQLERGTSAARGASLVRAAGGDITRDLHIINGLGAEMSAAAAAKLADAQGIRSVSLNGAVEPSAVDTSQLATAYTQSVGAPSVWNATDGSAGEGVGVAVVDTGIQGDLPDFRVSQSDSTSRVVADAVVNPDAKTAADGYGHGTHVAGLIAGNGLNRTDGMHGKYVGVAPAADLINVKVSDDEGNATTLDVIDGLQFVVDHKDEFNIRVVNLSLNEATPSSYRTNPLNAAVEQAWNAGIVVVAAAGNRGTAADAVHYAPGNDPFVITVGGVDDKDTADSADDSAASWSSTGTTRDGHAKPELLAPGAHMVSTLARNSEITEMCPSCVVGRKYFRMGGTSMATGVASGAVALMVAKHPSWTPNQVKSALRSNLRQVPGAGMELDVEAAIAATKNELRASNAFRLNSYLDAATGAIDYSRSSWSRSSWSRSSWSRSSWSRSSWSCTTCSDEGNQVDPSRSSWSRSSWSRSSWSASFSK